ncbi:MAG: DNA primase [Myxococcales bacterium]|nr:MAG: DNA primase [Myxococcales bacterium]
MISESKIAEIRERTDILAIVGEYVNLKRMGASSKGLCPFHAEKTPSFYVHPDRQFFHCFGCGVSGDVFSFMMRMENRSFPEVAEQLAERSGIELPVMDPHKSAQEARQKSQKDRWYALIEDAAGFYMTQLKEHQLAVYAKSELKKRGVDSELATQFRLGYAPAGWRSLVEFLSARGHSLADAEMLGLIVSKRGFSEKEGEKNAFYDRFRHRLMFPISDSHGRIVAFSGRMLENPPGTEDKQQSPAAKYVNSPDTPLYKKGNLLFGLHEARVAVRRAQKIVLCEGNFDLLALHQAKIPFAAAPLGTALTESQAKLIRRFADTVILLFDADAAGAKAVQAAFPILSASGLNAKVVALPPGSDPDSFVREHGAEALSQRLDSAVGVVEYLIDRASELAPADAKGKADAVASLGRYIHMTDNPVELQLYIERVARRFGLVDLGAVRAQLRRGKSETKQSRANESAEKKLEKLWTIPKHTRTEWEILGAFLDFPKLFSDQRAELFVELLTDTQVRVIFHAAAGIVATRGVVDATLLLEQLGEIECRSLLERRVSVQKHEAKAAEEILDRGIVQLAKQNIERELPMLATQVKEARRLGNDQQALELTKERDRLFRSAQRAMQVAKG